MRRGLLVAICLVLIISALGVIGCSPDFYPAAPETGAKSQGIITSQQATGVWVTGEGRVSVVPDVAILSLGVEVQKATVAEAQGEAAEAMEAVLAELKAGDVAEKDIKTQQYTITPVRKWHEDKEILLGYRVTNIVTAKIRVIGAAGDIVDAVAIAGGDSVRINSISFTIDEPTAYYAEAREKAMADAQAKAEQLADLADIILGDPTYISEGIGYVPRAYEVRVEAAVPVPATTPISPGEMEVRLTVQVVYEID